jgi:integrase
VLLAAQQASADAAILVACTERGTGIDLPHADQVAAIADRLDIAGIRVKDLLLVDAGRWWAYGCATPGCCPVTGTAFTPVGQARTRDDVLARYQPMETLPAGVLATAARALPEQPSARADATLLAARRLAEALTAQDAGAAGTAGTAGTAVRAGTAGTAGTAGSAVSAHGHIDRDTAMVIVGVQQVLVRDYLAAMATLEPGSRLADAVTIPRPRKKQQATWTPHELRLLMEVLRHHRAGRLFVLQAATGARRGELMALRWGDINLDTGMVTFRANRVAVPGGHVEHTTKNDEPKAVRLDEETVRMLRFHRIEQRQDRLKSGPKWLDAGYVFTNANGGPFFARNLNRYWKQAVEKAGVAYLKPHALRHTHATLLLEAGVPMHVVSSRLGHKDVATTMRVYAQVTAHQDQSAAQVYADWLQS